MPAGRVLRRAAAGVFCWALLSGVFAASVTAEITIRDDRDVTIRLEAPARRVIALSPHLAELVHAAGAGSTLIGAVRYSDFPAAVRSLPLVGDAAKFDAEAVLALRPDLLLAWVSGNPAGEVERLERLGLKVYATEPARLADIPRIMRSLGTLTGFGTSADQAAVAFEREWRALRARHASLRRLRAFYEVWPEPLLTLSGRHVVSEVMDLCGGDNVFAGLSSLTPAVSMEALVAARPEVIVGGGSAQDAAAFSAYWQRHPVTALRAVPAFYVEPDSIQRATPRLLAGAGTICAAFEQVRSRRKPAS